MKIAFCHSNPPQNLIEEFLKKWPMYSYVPIDNQLTGPENMTVEESEKFLFDGQRVLTGKLCDAVQAATDQKFVLHNNTMLNILADSILCVEHGFIKNSDFLANQFVITQNMLKFLDIIFWLSDKSKTDDPWEQQTRAMFEAFNKDSWENTGLIFPLKDRPAFVEIPFDRNNPKVSIRAISEYITPLGTIYNPEDADIGSVLNNSEEFLSPEDLEQLLAR